MHCLLCLLAAALLLLPASAQPRRAPLRPPAAARYTLEQLQFQGNHAYSAAQLTAITGLKLGQGIDKPTLETVREKLTATGAFQSVGYEFRPAPSGRGYLVIFDVAEIAELYPFQLEDLPLTTAEAAAFFQKEAPLFTGKIPGNDVVFRQYAQRLQDFLAARGTKETIVAKLNEDAVVVFRPNSPAPTIAEVKFTGNQLLSGPVLQAAIANVAVGTPYTETRFRQQLNASVRPLYEARGRLNVTFPQISVAKAEDVKGQRLTVTVNEGETYTLSTVTLRGAPGDPQPLLSEIKLKKGDLANFDELNAGLDRIRQDLRREGYLDAIAKAARTLDEKTHTVALAIQVTPGSRFSFGQLTIEGLDITSEPVIRKLWGDRAGKPFNADFPGYFLQRVKEEGIFDFLGETKYAISRHNDTQTVDVTLTFTAQKPKPKSSPIP